MRTSKNQDEQAHTVGVTKSSLIWKILKRFLVATGTLAFAYLCLVFFITYMPPAVTLPNGYRLVPFLFDKNKISIYTPEGKMAVRDHVDDIGWCDEIIYGTQYINHHLFDEKLREAKRFLYDGKKGHLEYIDFFPHTEHRGAYNLPEWPGPFISYNKALHDSYPSNACPNRTQNLQRK